MPQFLLWLFVSKLTHSPAHCTSLFWRLQFENWSYDLSTRSPSSPCRISNFQIMFAGHCLIFCKILVRGIVMRKEGCSADDVKYCSTVLGPSVWFHWSTSLIKELPLWGMTMSIELYRRQQLIPCTLLVEAEFSCQCFLQPFWDSLLRSRMAIRLFAPCFHFCESQAWRRILQKYEMWFSNFLWNPSPFSKQELILSWNRWRRRWPRNMWSLKHVSKERRKSWWGSLSRRKQFL